MSDNLEHFLILMLVSIVMVALLHWVSTHLGLESETKRKLLHFNAGAMSLAMPWLFDRPWPAFLFCLIFLVGLSAVRWHPWLRTHLGSDIYSVKRKSFGELLFPIAVALLFWLSNGEKVLFVVPLLVLTTADGAAALAAKRYGLSPYKTIRGKKTWEGTFVFFCVAFVATIAPLLLLSHVERGDVLLIGCLIGLIGCIIEATTWSGVDNFFIPLGTYFALKRLLQMNAAELVLELAFVVIVMSLAVIWSRHTRLTTQANLCAVLVAFILWSVGGIPWVAPAVLTFLLHPILTRLPTQDLTEVDLRSICSVSSCCIVWMALYRLGPLRLESSLYAASVGLVAHLCMISFVRRQNVVGATVKWSSHLYWATIATAVVIGCYEVIIGSGRILLACVAIVMASTTSLLFSMLPIRGNSGRRWVLQAVFALLASYAGFLVQQLPVLLSSERAHRLSAPIQLDCVLRPESCVARRSMNPSTGRNQSFMQDAPLHEPHRRAPAAFQLARRSLG